MEIALRMHFKDRLRQERIRRNWSQQNLADRLEVTVLTIKRWERGIQRPRAYFCLKLCTLFGMSASELGLVLDELQTHDEAGTASSFHLQISLPPAATATASFWNIPFRRNPCFTGREEALARLHERFCQDETMTATSAQALNGLGGIGKTQLAVEYAYRYRGDYQAILWVRAETHEILATDFTSLAELLHLPERSEREQCQVMEAVKRWLGTHDHWLLILDNVEDALILTDVLPSEYKGHTLITTRSQATGVVAWCIDVTPMEPEEGALLLLRRAKLLAYYTLLTDVPELTCTQARRISHVLGGLPLALDQAGAYIEETGCSLADYLDRYQKHPLALLNRRGTITGDHPSSVLTTFSLSFQRIEQMHPKAADLLRLCAFLQPDAIPEDLFFPTLPVSTPELLPAVLDPVQFDEALATLRRYSLLKRNSASKTLTVHRLVQVALYTYLPLETHHIWAEYAVALVNLLFPNISFCSHELISPTLFAQASWCEELIARWNLSSQDAARLLLKLVAYVQWRGDLTSAEQLLVRGEALYLRRGRIELSEALSLWNLQARQGWEQGQYWEAEEVARRAVRWSHRLFGQPHALVAASYGNLGVALYSLGKYTEAEETTKQALHFIKQIWGEENAQMIGVLITLANIYYKQEHYEKAVLIFQQAVEIAQKTPDIDSLQLALLYEGLGTTYRDMQRYPEAVAFLEEALRLREDLDLPHHPYQALTLNSLSGCFFRQGNYAKAECVLRQALAIQRQNLHPEHEAIATTLNNLAKNLVAQEKDTEAEDLYQQALALFEKALGEEHLHVSVVLLNLAALAEKHVCPAKAALFYQRALKIQECVLGAEHPSVVQIAERYKNIQSFL